MAIFAFFKRQLLLFHAFGVPVKVDYRWFLVLILMTALTASLLSPNIVENYPARLFLSLVANLALLACVFLHELAHAFAARSEGIETREIVLHPFGGLARLKREPDSPRAEFRIAIAGPVASFAIALAAIGLTLVSENLGARAFTPLFFFLFICNLLLAIFNLFPGYPLDGGRVLRAFLWHRGRDLAEATILTGRCGQLIGLALVVFGVFAVFVRGDFTGLWTALVGLFLFDSARDIIRQTERFENLNIEEVMSAPLSVEPQTSVANFVDRTLPLIRQTAFLVAHDRQFQGVLSLEDIKDLPREKWHETKIQDVMRPIGPEYFVELESPLREARDLLRENGIGILGVIDESGKLVGFLQRGRLKKRQ
jgi:Zn-dependent protease